MDTDQQAPPVGKTERDQAAAEQDQPRRNAPQQQEQKPKGRKGIFFLVVLGLLVLLGILAALGIFPRFHKDSERKETTKDVSAGAATVKVTKPTHSPVSFDFSLPGSAEPLTTATLYARVNGYLKHRLVDIGDKVKEGQLLAEIDAPDIEAQLNQSRAQLEQSRAALGIAQVTFEREKKLLGEKVVSKQEYDQSEANYNQAVANVKAGESAVQNLSVSQGFERITAPFAGIVTARFLDEGALISTGSGTTSPSIFTIQQSDVLRVFIYVPQAYVANVKPGQEVQVTTTDYPHQIFKGTVTRMADALDPVTRTERVEIQLPSEDGKLKPGFYLSIKFTVTQDEPALVVPANAVDIRREGPRVALVQKDSKIKFQQVQLGRDFGKTMEIVAGLSGEETLVINPAADLVEGQTVQIAKEEAKKTPPN